MRRRGTAVPATPPRLAHSTHPGQPPRAGLHDPRVRTGYGISHGLLAFVLNFRVPVPILCPTSYPTRYPVLAAGL